MTTETEYRFTSSTMTVATFGTRGDVTSAKAVVTDYRGKTLNETDEYNVSTQYEYDGYGRLTKSRVTSSDGTVGAVQSYSYNEDGSLYSADNGLNGQRYTYDEQEQLIKTTLLEFDGEDTSLKATEYSTETKYGVFRDQPLEVSEHIGIDTVASNKVTYEKGRIRTVTDGTAKYGVKYDDVNSTVEYTQFDGDTERTVQRDSVSEYVTNTDGSVTQTHTSTFYDEDGNTESTSTELDTYGQVLNVKRNDETFTYGYTDSSESRFALKPTSCNSTNGQTTEFSYDDDGNLVGWKETRSGSSFEIRQIAEDVSLYKFFGDDRCTAVQRDSQKVLSPRVTAAKNMRYIQSDTGARTEDIAEFCQEYTYDELGRTDKSEIKDNSRYEYEYLTVGSNSLLKTQNYRNYAFLYPYSDPYSCADIQVKDTIEYYSDGKIRSITQPYSWKVVNTPYSKTYAFSGTTVKEYEYDKAGRITKETLTAQRQNGVKTETVKTYEYGTGGRINKVTTDGYRTESGVTTHTTKGETERRLYDEYGRLSGKGATSYFYDRYGNRTSETYKGEGTVYEYKNGSVLYKVNKDGVKSEYTYNADGVRIGKTVNGTKTEYYLDGNKILGEQRGADKYRYYYGRDGLIGFQTETRKYHYVYDSQGNITMLFGNNFLVEIARYEYDAYDNCTVYDGDGKVNKDPNFIGNVNPFRWKGFYYDVETGLYYANGSYYDPEVGLYVDASPIDTVIDNALTTTSLDRNAPICNNILELASNPYTINTATELSPDPNYDPTASRSWLYRTLDKIAKWYSNLHWGIKLGVGLSLLTMAVVLSVVTDGTGAAAIGVLIQVAIEVGVGIGMYALSSLIAGTFSWSGLANAALDAFLVSSAIAFISSSVNLVKHLTRCKPISQTELAKCTNQCFIAGTLVHCEDGLKKIEEVQIGDKVLSYNEETGEQEYKKVVRLFRNESKDWIGITVNSTEIVSTLGHKYYLPKTKQWVSAKDLKADDTVLLSNGQYAKVQSIRQIHYDAPQTTYNFEVEDNHTYYVGKGVLVHNQNCVLQELGAKDFNEVGNKYTSEQLINKLDDIGFSKTVTYKSVNSGPSVNMTRNNLTFRIQGSPANGKPYFRVYNGANPLDANGVFPSWATRQQVRNLTHFYFGG